MSFFKLIIWRVYVNFGFFRSETVIGKLMYREKWDSVDVRGRVRI